MNLKFTFRKKYAFWAVLLLIIEIFIGIYVKDNFIRPYAGDFLVVILLYCMVMSVVKIRFIKAAVGVLGFAFLLEILQYFELVKLLGLQDIKLARIIIGTSFAWEDLVAYSLGILLVLGIEKINSSIR